MILELTVGVCYVCRHISILFDDGEAYICVDRDTCSNQETPKEVQTVYISKFGPVRSMYYNEKEQK